MVALKFKQILKENNLFMYTYIRLRESYFRYLFSDKSFIRHRFKKTMGYKINLDKPRKFTEKLQWLKLYWYDPLAEKCADKFEVRKVVEEKVGSHILNEIYGVYDSIEQIDIHKLPQAFVLKATHSSGQNFVCRDKSRIDWAKQSKVLNRWLKTNYYWGSREWVYKDLKPRIICEKLLIESNDYESLTDYKIYCFNGIPKYCQVIKDREQGDGTIDFFDVNWNNMGFSGLRKAPNSIENINRPEKFEEMIEISKILSREFPFVRVDFYYVNNKIYFGELTFFPNSGLGEFTPSEWDERLGELIELPKQR